MVIEDRLALGIGLGYLWSEQSIIPRSGRQDPTFTARASDLNLSFGLSARAAPHHWLGFSFSPEVTLRPSQSQAPDSLNSSAFIRSVNVPARASLGWGWVPNSAFRIASSLHFIFATHDTRLLRDWVSGSLTNAGDSLNSQVRLGISYSLVKLQQLEGKIQSGTYLELERQAGGMSRPHVTGALELLPWILRVAFGFDLAKDYQNLSFSLGLELGAVARELEIIPVSTEKRPESILPNHWVISDEGLENPWRSTKYIGPDQQSPSFEDYRSQVPSRIQHLPEKVPSLILKSQEDLNELQSDFQKLFDSLFKSK
jgi:hypothetical protein